MKKLLVLFLGILLVLTFSSAQEQKDEHIPNSPCIPIGEQIGSVEIDVGDSTTQTVILYESLNQPGRFFYTPLLLLQTDEIKEIPVSKEKTVLQVPLTCNRSHIKDKLMSSAQILGEDLIAKSEELKKFEPNPEQIRKLSQMGGFLKNANEDSFIPIDLSKLEIRDISKYYTLEFETLLNPGINYEILYLTTEVEGGLVDTATKYIKARGSKVRVIYSYPARTTVVNKIEIAIRDIRNTNVFQNVFGSGVSLERQLLSPDPLYITRDQRLSLSAAILQELYILIIKEGSQVDEDFKKGLSERLLKLFGGDEPVTISLERLAAEYANISRYDWVNPEHFKPDNIKKFARKYSEFLEDTTDREYNFNQAITGRAGIYSGSCKGSMNRKLKEEHLRNTTLDYDIKGDIVVPKGIRVYRIDKGNFKGERFIIQEEIKVTKFITTRQMLVSAGKWPVLKHDCNKMKMKRKREIEKNRQRIISCGANFGSSPRKEITINFGQSYIIYLERDINGFCSAELVVDKDGNFFSRYQNTAKALEGDVDTKGQSVFFGESIARFKWSGWNGIEHVVTCRSADDPPECAEHIQK